MRSFDKILSTKLYFYVIKAKYISCRGLLYRFLQNCTELFVALVENFLNWKSAYCNTSSARLKKDRFMILLQ